MRIVLKNPQLYRLGDEGDSGGVLLRHGEGRVRRLRYVVLDVSHSLLDTLGVLVAAVVDSSSY